MATKVETFTRTTYRYKFYCDDCGAYLGESEEYDDGYLPDPDDVYCLDLSIDVGEDTFYFKKDCICKQCYSKLLENIATGLQAIGFKNEEN